MAQTNRPLTFRLLACALLLATITLLAVRQSGDEQRRERSFSITDLLSYRGWIFPIEFNPQRKVPFIGDSLKAIAMSPDEDELWVGGASGALLLSKDNAGTWDSKSVVGAPMITKIQVIQNHKLIIQTSDGRIGFTSDEGKSWNFSTLNLLSGESVKDLDFDMSSKKAWIVTDRGRLFSSATSNKEIAWKEEWVIPASASNECKVAHIAVNSSHGLALISCDALLYYNADAGWIQLASNIASVSALAISPDGTTVWLGAAGKVLSSKNLASKDWSVHEFGDIGTRMISASKFVFDKNTPNVFGVADGRVFSASPEKANVQWLNYPSDDIRDLAITSAHHTLAVTDDGGILQGNTTGRAIANRTLGASGTYRRIIPHPSIQGEFVVLNSNGLLLETHGGGRSLSEFRFPSETESVLDIAARNSHEVWAVGDHGLSTPDEDNARSKTNTNSDLWTVRFAANGDMGLIGASSGIFLTVDGGENWREVLDQDERERIGIVNEIFFRTDGTSAYAVTRGGYFLASASDITKWKEHRLSVDLQSIWFVGAHGWVAGAQGTILSCEITANGLDWKAQDSGTAELIYRIRFASDALHGWAVGNSGLILHTSDGGRHWHSAKSGTRVNLRDVIWDEKAARVWVVGWGNTVLLSEDGGIGWRKLEGMEGTVNRRFPAPWYWVVTALLLWFAWSSARAAAGGQTSSIPAIAVSDNPIASATEDKFAFSPLAHAISAFVRNVNTRPPFIVALTGQWGSGKSSVMRLIDADLKSNGFRPVWWNAWHYQDETSALSSAMEHIRSQSTPDSLLENVRFRWRLVYGRITKLVRSLLIILLGAIAAVAWLTFVESHEGMHWLFLQLKESFRSHDPLGYLLGALGFSGVAWILHLARPFSAQSKRTISILRVLAATAQVRGLTDDTGIRYRFATQFRELTDALAPSQLVLIVDDLDRCHPDRVVNVLETLNFLVTSGNCIVILGMDLDRVLASLSLSFEKVAKVNIKTDIVNGEIARPSTESPELTFASSYLRKMVNLEVRVPTVGLNIQRLMFGTSVITSAVASPTATRHISVKLGVALLARSLMRRVRRLPDSFYRRKGAFSASIRRLVSHKMSPEFASKVAHAGRATLQFCVLIAAGLFCGQRMVKYLDPIPTPPKIESALPADFLEKGIHAKALGDKPPNERESNASLLLRPTSSLPSPPATVIPASENGNFHLPQITFFLFVVFMVGIWRAYSHGQVHDSRAFELAIQEWGDKLSESLVTPREMKRFLNRVRFAALRVRSENQSFKRRLTIERTRHLLTGRWLIGPSRRDAKRKLTLDEETLVRLAAYEMCGNSISELLMQQCGNAAATDEQRARIARVDKRLAELLFANRNSSERAAALQAYSTILSGIRY